MNDKVIVRIYEAAKALGSMILLPSPDLIHASTLQTKFKYFQFESPKSFVFVNYKFLRIFSLQLFLKSHSLLPND